MEKVDTAAYNTARITGDYAFGCFWSRSVRNNRTAIAGRFTGKRNGPAQQRSADENMSGSFSTMNLLAGLTLPTR